MSASASAVPGAVEPREKNSFLDISPKVELDRANVWISVNQLDEQRLGTDEIADRDTPIVIGDLDRPQIGAFLRDYSRGCANRPNLVRHDDDAAEEPLELECAERRQT